MIKQTLIASLLAVAFAAPAFAQTATPGIDQRGANQEKRIEQGEKSGALTQREAANLEKRETKLANDKAAAAADGKVTKAERRKLNREANRDSKAIYKKKHNARTAPPAQ